MHGVMKTKEIYVAEINMGNLFCEINPESQTKRQNVAGRSLTPKVYNAKYFGDKIHYDPNEKLEMFGVVHGCARDGFSGKIFELATMARRNHLVIYEEICRLMITFFIYKDGVFQIWICITGSLSLSNKTVTLLYIYSLIFLFILFLYLFVYLFIYLSSHLFICLCIYLFSYLFVLLFNYLLIYLFIYFFIFLFFYFFIYLFIYIFIKNV